jgi:hypothetical protein
MPKQKSNVPMTIVNWRVSKEFIDRVDKHVREKGYRNRTEFIVQCLEKQMHTSAIENSVKAIAREEIRTGAGREEIQKLIRDGDPEMRDMIKDVVKEELRSGVFKDELRTILLDVITDTFRRTKISE